jgi:archaellum component FlaC
MLQFLFSCWCYLQLAEEKNSVSKWMEDYKILSHDFEVLQHDHTVLCDKYQSEIEVVDKLKVGILNMLFYRVL